MALEPFKLEHNASKKVWYQATGNTTGLTIPYKIWYNITGSYLVSGNLTELSNGLYFVEIQAPNYDENLLFIIDSPPGCSPARCREKRKCVSFKVGDAPNILFYDGSDTDNPRVIPAQIRDADNDLLSSQNLIYRIDWIYTISLEVCSTKNVVYLIYIEDDKAGLTLSDPADIIEVSGVKAFYCDFDVSMEKDEIAIDMKEDELVIDAEEKLSN